jgi:hypothetical protein
MFYCYVLLLCFIVTFLDNRFLDNRFFKLNIFPFFTEFIFYFFNYHFTILYVSL